MAEINYPKLNENSICIRCTGCSLLENLKFYGKKECENFENGEEPFYYGSKYGNNN